MIYLYAYLGIGAAMLAAIFIEHRRTKSHTDDDFLDLVVAVSPHRDKWWWKPLNKVVVPLVAAAFAVVAWPIAIYWKVREIVDARLPQDEKDSTNSSADEFFVKREHLQKRMSLDDIESAEIVLDPLCAAPRIPFGHLNTAWENFKQSLQPDDELWSFSAPRTTEWGAVKSATATPSYIMEVSGHTS